MSMCSDIIDHATRVLENDSGFYDGKLITGTSSTYDNLAGTAFSDGSLWQWPSPSTIVTSDDPEMACRANQIMGSKACSCGKCIEKDWYSSPNASH